MTRNQKLIPKRLILIALIAFSMILLSQEKAFAPEETTPAASSTASQGQDTEVLQIEPNPIVFQVGIDTTTPFDTIELAFGGISVSNLALTPTDVENVTGSAAIGNTLTGSAPGNNKAWLSLPPGFSRTPLPERPLDRPPSQPLSRPFQRIPSGVRLPGQDPSPDSRGLAQSEPTPTAVATQEVLEVLL